ncbi:hypothetical protein WR25_21244 [Diploscapter pachys]|uniref:Frizzled-4 n=1 Tax=Diploscapter pachys TaxID=2018661 RepID=A0A2A2JDI6_9BILA|nr:hypothetical protein WR25_21244 [Diploscapter pachys]
MKPRISIYLFLFCISLILSNSHAAEIKKPVLKARQDEKEARNQAEANAAISTYNPLVKVKCSEDIKLFLCAAYFPVCTQIPTPLPPCRDLCLSAQQGCENLMKKFGYSWPGILDCRKFPVSGLCVGRNQSKPASDTPANSANFECPSTMRAVTGSRFSLQLASVKLQDCSMPCEADNQTPIFFNSRMRRYLRIWTGAWSMGCCVCSLFTVITFLIDLDRFAYPVRPILYMALCYFAISIVYMIGVVGEDRFACGNYGSTPTQLVTQEGENVWCSALAVAHYYFLMASSAWWVIMCLAWFLAANLKWGAESIAGLAAHFHAIAWGIPGVLSVVVLITNSVDGDVFTGICSVGNLQPAALFYFIFIPLISCLVFGVLLLMCGIWSMIRIRSYIKLQHADVDRNISKLEKLMFRISAFAVIYALPTAVSALILFYQSMNMPQWIEAWYSERCLRSDREQFGFSISAESCPTTQNDLQLSRPPEMTHFMIKYVAQLVVGITCAVWVCSSKTWSSYQRAYGILCHRRSAISTTEH